MGLVVNSVNNGKLISILATQQPVCNNSCQGVFLLSVTSVGRLFSGGDTFIKEGKKVDMIFFSV